MSIQESGECPLPNGNTLIWKLNEAGGRTYYSTEIGGGVVVWDTCLCDESTLRAALMMEEMFDREFKNKRIKDLETKVEALMKFGGN
jgi:hypothetical protein